MGRGNMMGQGLRLLSGTFFLYYMRCPKILTESIIIVPLIGAGLALCGFLIVAVECFAIRHDPAYGTEPVPRSAALSIALLLLFFRKLLIENEFIHAHIPPWLMVTMIICERA